VDKAWFAHIQEKFAHKRYPHVSAAAKPLAVAEMERWRVSIDPTHSWCLPVSQIHLPF